MNTSNRANRSGKQLENFVENILQDYEYVNVSKTRFFALCVLKQPIYAQECSVGKTIYGGIRSVDFILYHPIKWSECLVIECKWQSSSGTTDQKYPYFVESININPQPTIIVLDGGGQSRASVQWLKAQAGKKKVLHVLNQGEFARFASAGKL